MATRNLSEIFGLNGTTDLWNASQDDPEAASTSPPVSTETAPFDPFSPENFVAALLIGVLSLATILSNCGALFIVHRKPAMHNSFGVLCVSHALGDIGAGVAKLGWSIQILPFIGRNIWSETASFFIGEVVMIFFFIVLYSHTLKAINRLIAIANPSLYYRHFGMRKTTIAIAFAWAVSFARLFTFAGKGCHIWFDNENFVWNNEGPCADSIYLYMDVIWADILLGILVVCDCITFLCLRRYYKRVSVRSRKIAFADQVTITANPTTAGSTVTMTGSVGARKEQYWKDVRFFVQGVCIGVCYVTLTSLSFVRFPSLEQAQVVQQLARGTLLWLAVSFLDGLVVIVFNFGLKR